MVQWATAVQQRTTHRMPNIPTPPHPRPLRMCVSEWVEGSQANHIVCVNPVQDVIDDERHPEGFILEGSAPQAQAEEQTPEAAAAADANGTVAGSKRSREEEPAAAAAAAAAGEAEQQQEQPAAKRQKQQEEEQEGGAVGAGTADEPVELMSSDGEGDALVISD